VCVLIAVASKHGATYGVGAEIARVIADSGIQSDLCRVSDVAALDGYDAVVLGSAVYMGHWMPEATAFIERQIVELSKRPVWLFSSGPIGDPPKGTIDGRLLDRLLVDTGARDHQLFAGSIDPADLGLKEKVVTKVVRAPSGDYRDWATIEAWARTIAAELKAQAAVVQ
jgi:menaquinone-dependent protoporphyrinogen oxidase